MIRAIVIGILCLATAPLPGAGETPPATKPFEVPVAPSPPLGQSKGDPYAGLPVGGGIRGGSCAGIVTSVDNATLTVIESEKRIEQWSPEGKLVNVTIIPPQPPRVFTAVGPLSRGTFSKNGIPRAQYRLSDVKVGDLVFFDWRQANGLDEIHYVWICRRSGGRVPPSPGEAPGEENPWHEEANAKQDFEEKGIPLPEKYRPKPTPPLPPLPQ